MVPRLVQFDEMSVASIVVTQTTTTPPKLGMVVALCLAPGLGPFLS